jgi:hypothetical protein
MEFLKEDCEGIWIGRGGLVAWPPRSPKLNPLDIFLWGGMKLRMYHGGKLEAKHQLLEAIDEATIGIRKN